jgi:hypothetical protein
LQTPPLISLGGSVFHSACCPSDELDLPINVMMFNLSQTVLQQSKQEKLKSTTDMTVQPSAQQPKPLGSNSSIVYNRARSPHVLDTSCVRSPL